VTSPNDGLQEARAALARRDWAVAYEGLRDADPSILTGRDLEGLADAAWWCSRLRESLEARQRACTAYETEGDDDAVAATAARVAVEHFVRDEPAIGAGYLQRARRFAERLPEGPGHGFLAMVEANVARFSGDLDGAIALARQAAETGRRFGDRDLVAMALHTEGLAAIDAGRTTEGVALLDEAMTDVIAGDLDPYFTGIIYCALIAACLELQDVRRAGEWSDAAMTWCASLQPDAPFTSMCRVNKAEVARLRGSWPEAEREAARASTELEAIEPGVAASAYVQLGEIRRRTGDLAGAESAFARAHALGGDPQPGFALLRLAQGKGEVAMAALRAALTTEHHPARRARLLAAQVEAGLLCGAKEEAASAAAELTALAVATGSPALEAAAAQAAGTLLLADGDAAAVEPLRRATSGWQATKVPYETARAQVLLGRALVLAGDDEGGRLEFRAALATFERLGAAPDAAAVTTLLGSADALPGGLTAREAEVLRLVAAGKTNRDIAVELVISEHTVGRHLQNIFAKLGVSSRAAATAYAYEHDLT
jgi:ATP/maltotriose-dependent transcriptional regulator MalT